MAKTVSMDQKMVNTGVAIPREVGQCRHWSPVSVSASWRDLYLSPRHVARNWDKLAASCPSSSLSWAQPAASQGSLSLLTTIIRIMVHTTYTNHHTPHSAYTTYIIVQSPNISTLILPPVSTWNVAKIKHLGQQLLAVYFTVLHLSIVSLLILGPWLEPGAWSLSCLTRNEFIYLDT